MDFYHRDFRLNTYVIIWIVQTSKIYFGGTYLDYFFLFQAAGFWGIILMMRIFEEIYIELEMPQSNLTYLMLLLPGVHFWTSAIGKDALLFFATSLAVWAGMRIRRRYIAFGAAIVLMVLIRPHIAFLGVISLAAAAFFDPHTRYRIKAMLLVGAMIGAFVVAGTIQSTFSVDVTNADSVTDFFAANAEVSQNMEGGSAVVGASFPVRILSLLFRPLFFDVQDAFGWIVSVENLFLLFVVGTIVIRLRTTIALARQIFFLRFALFFAIALVLLLGYVYYNVGLGLRQKMMMMPALLTFFAAVVAVRQVRRAQPVLGFSAG
jgi:hypothetical protein